MGLVCWTRPKTWTSFSIRGGGSSLVHFVGLFAQSVSQVRVIIPIVENS